MKKDNIKVIASLTAAAVLVICAFTVPGGEVITKQMTSLIFMVLAAIVLWVFQPMSIGFSSLLIMTLQPLAGVSSSLAEAYAGFANPTNFFTIASFGVALALSKTSVPTRLLASLLRICGNDAKKITLAFMFLTYVISTVISDITAVIISLEFAMALLAHVGDEEERRRLGKIFLISIPLGSLLGGTATPVGSSINVMAANLLKGYNGVDISFVEWMKYGLPVSLVTMFATWLLICAFFKTGTIDSKALESFRNEYTARKNPLRHEGLVIAILALTVVMWVLSSWIPAFNTTTVAVFSLILLAAPFAGAFTWKEFRDSVAWELPLMGAATIGLSNAAVKCGVVGLLVDKLQSVLPSNSPFILVCAVGALVTLVLLLIPVGPAAVSMLAIPSYALGEKLGVNPAMMLVLAAMMASNSSILPLNAVMYIPYSKGYWKIGDMARVGVIMSVFWVLLAALYLPLAAT